MRKFVGLGALTLILFSINSFGFGKKKNGDATARCGFKALTQECRIFDDKKSIFLDIGHGESVLNFTPINNNSASDKELSVISKVDSAKYKTLVELIKYSQKSIVDLIYKNAQEPVAAELVKKINSIRVEVAKETAENTECASSEDWAKYSVYSHTLNVCPVIAYQPKLSALLVIAHEVAHAIDPCSFHGGLDSVDLQKLTNIIDQDSEGLSQATLRGVLDFASNFDSPYLNLESAFTIVPNYELETLEKLRVKGALTKFTSGYLSLESYPFKNGLECMYEKIPFTHTSAQVLKEQKLDLPAVEAEKFKSWSGCSIRINRDNYMSQSQEVLPDWLAMQVVRSYLKNHPSKNKGDKFFLELFGFFASAACAFSREENIPEGIERLPPVSSRPDLRRVFDSHIPDILRFNAIVRDFPEVREALYCSEAEHIECSEKISK